jgi:hypothetical protein
MLLSLVTLAVQKIQTAIFLKSNQSEAANSGFPHALLSCTATFRHAATCPESSVKIVSSYRDRGQCFFRARNFAEMRSPNWDKYTSSALDTYFEIWILGPGSKGDSFSCSGLVPARAVERFRFRWKNFLFCSRVDTQQRNEICWIPFLCENDFICWVVFCFFLVLRPKGLLLRRRK